MKMRRVDGTKNKYGNDLPLQICTNGWEIPTNDDILTMIDAVFENEDRIYPKPKFKGAGLFMDEIIKRYGKYLEKDKKSNEQNGIDAWM
jgi:hypothetical protein